MRILLDHSVPVGLRSLLAGHEIETAVYRRWDALTNGELLAAVEAASFEVFVTADQNLRFQQNLAGRPFGTVILGTNRWRLLRDNPGPIIAAVGRARPGSVEIVSNMVAAIPP